MTATVAPDVCIIYNESGIGNSVVIHVSKTPSPEASLKASPTKPYKKRRPISDTEQVLLMAKWALMMEAIEKNTRPVKVARLTMVYNAMAILSLTLAMFFTLTMTYILWIGFYPPTRLNSPFFIDRLKDFKVFLEGLQNGSIFQSLTDMFADSMMRSVQKEVEARQYGFSPGLPIGSPPMMG